MLRLREHLLHRTLLDDLAVVHDTDHVGDAPHDAEVVGDEQQAHAEPLADVGQQLEDLRLHRHVERGGRLVGDQEVRLVRQRHRDHHALALAAGELVRVGAEPRGGIADADLGQELDDAFARGGPTHAAVQHQDLADLPLDRVQRIERGHRLLEDDRDVVAAELAQLAFRQCQDLAALEADLAGRMMRGRGQELHHAQRAHRFARAGFADQRHALSLVDPE
jgi:hypothetical protein